MSGVPVTYGIMASHEPRSFRRDDASSHRGTRRCRRALGHPRRRRRGQGAAGGGRARDRLRGGRARLPHPDAHRRRPPPPPASTPRTTTTRRRPACPSCARPSPTRPRRDSGLSVEPGQVLVTNGGKQAVAHAFAVLCDPGDEVLILAPYWTTYPESVALAGGTPVIVETDGGQRLPGDHRGPDGGADPAHQGAPLRLAVQPDRRRLPARRGRGDRPLGARAGPVGRDRRDLRAPRLRLGRAPLDAGRRPRAGRPVPGRERRGQDLRHDRLARWGG